MEPHLNPAVAGTGTARSRSSQSQTPSPSHSTASISATSSLPHHHHKRKLPHAPPPSDDLSPRADDSDSIAAATAASDDDDDNDGSSIRTFTAARLERTSKLSKVDTIGGGGGGVKVEKVEVSPENAAKDGGERNGVATATAVKEENGVKSIFTENIQTSGAYSAREEGLRHEMAGGGKDRLVHQRNVIASAWAREGLQFEEEVAPVVEDRDDQLWHEIVQNTVDRDFAELAEDGGVADRVSGPPTRDVVEETLGRASEGGAERARRGRLHRSDASSSSVVAPKKKKSSKDVSWMIFEPVPGGPRSGRVIPSFGGHIAHTLWSTPNVSGRPVLIGYHRFGLCRRILSPYNLQPAVKTIYDASGLSHLPDSMAENYNMPLISAFVERWQPDTNTFHMPFGEISILLHDVAQILGVRIDGSSCKVENADGTLTDSLMYVCGFFGMSQERVKLPLHPNKKTPIYRSGGILADAVLDLASASSDDIFVQGFMAVVLGSTLFVDKTGDRIHPQLFPLVSDTRSVHHYAWGAGALAYMYRQLGVASRADVKTIGGCLTLLQSWIYEYFPMFRPSPPSAIKPTEPRACSWRYVGSFTQSEAKVVEYRRVLDGLTHSSIRWDPYGPRQEERYPRTLYSGCIRFMDIVEPYLPDRCIRQFGYVQMIPNPTMKVPAHRPASGLGYDVSIGEVADHLWDCWEDHQVQLSRRSTPVTVAGEAAPDYERWFTDNSHPYIIDPDHHDAPVPLDDGDVTAETAYSFINQFVDAQCIKDDTQQLQFFRNMMTNVQPLIDRAIIRRTREPGHIPGDRIQRRADGVYSDDEDDHP